MRGIIDFGSHGVVQTSRCHSGSGSIAAAEHQHDVSRRRVSSLWREDSNAPEACAYHRVWFDREFVGMPANHRGRAVSANR